MKNKTNLKNKIIPLQKLNVYAEDKSVLDDMDNAIMISNLILELFKIKKRPVLDFKNIKKVHPYWFVLCFYKYIIKLGSRVNEFIGVKNMTETQLKILNIVAKECQKNKTSIIDGIQTSFLPQYEE